MPVLSPDGKQSAAIIRDEKGVRVLRNGKVGEFLHNEVSSLTWSADGSSGRDTRYGIIVLNEKSDHGFSRITTPVFLADGTLRFYGYDYEAGLFEVTIR